MHACICVLLSHLPYIMFWKAFSSCGMGNIISWIAEGYIFESLKERCLTFGWWITNLLWVYSYLTHFSEEMVMQADGLHYILK